MLILIHPCDKGSVEGRIELIRRYIPKGDRMDKCSAEDIAKIEVWCNSLPRKILNYKTPEECFDVELGADSQKLPDVISKYSIYYCNQR